jgi:hypothetical protein
MAFFPKVRYYITLLTQLCRPHRVFYLFIGISIAVVLDPVISLALGAIILSALSSKLPDVRHVQHTLFVLCTYTIGLLVMSLIIWIKNLPWHNWAAMPQVDISTLLCVTAILSQITFGFNKIPQTNILTR